MEVYDYMFSIIIPHKNCVELLRRCLDSIPKRDDLQVIVVDDDSDPRQVDFSHFPGLNERNVNVIFTKEGKGAGFARNVGMWYATGKWLLFADADDYYTCEFVKLINQLERCENIDIVYFDAESENQRAKSLNEAMAAYFHSGGTKEMNTVKYNCWVPWNKAFSHSYIDSLNLKWEEIKIGNDAKFVLLAGYYSQKVKVVNLKCYMHTFNPSGITYHKKTFSEEYGMIPLGMNIVNFLRYVDMPWQGYFRALFNLRRFIIFARLYGFVDSIRYFSKILYYLARNRTFLPK